MKYKWGKSVKEVGVLLIVAVGLTNVEISGKHDEGSFDGVMEAKT